MNKKRKIEVKLAKKKLNAITEIQYIFIPLKNSFRSNNKNNENSLKFMFDTSYIQN